MQLAQKTLRRVNIFSPVTSDNGYIGHSSSPKPLGFVYANVCADKVALDSERRGRMPRRGATLILRREAGVACGDLAGVFGDEPDSRILEVTRFPNHITARTESL